jgi:ATP-dependent helicase HrpB
MRKIVLSSSIAETSLTIEDIRIVVDAGLMRVQRFDPRSSLTRLETVPVTQDAADQRRGRAGRTAPGICYRLWTRAAQQQLTPRRVPEMLTSDLTSLTLELAQWGVRDAAELAWLDPPPRASLAQARNLLVQLGALDDEGRITDHGTRLAELGLHPRLAHMILSALPIRRGAVACELGALLSERDILKGPERNVDIRQRLDVLRHNRTGSETSVDRAACRRILQSAQQWRRDLAIAADAEDDLDDIGRLLAFAYPDRIAQRQPGPDRRYQLANGRGAAFRHPDPLAAEEFLVVADLDGQSEWARLALAAPISRDQIERACAAAIRSVEVIEWDDRSQVVRSRQQQRLGALILRDQPISNPDPRRVTHALLEGIRQMGMVCLPWTPDLRQWQARVQFLRRIDQPDSWPDVSDANLVQTLQDWLGPFLNQVTGVETLKRIDLAAALHALLPWQQQQRMDRLAPTHITVPSGSRIRLDYESGDIPILAVRLQEMFGCRDTPRIAEGRAPILLHLLSPAGRPAQVTQDLAGFWATSYQEVRKALRGRYPKHAWPEDPLQAIPVKGARRVR